MKRILLTFLSVLLGLNAIAQTNFRTISYEEGLETAKAENKLLFIDFYTDWCGPCKMMAREIFPQKKMGNYMNNHFVNIKVNAEKGDGVELSKKYKIEAYPTFVIVNSEGNEVGRAVGGRQLDSFIAELDRMIDPTKSPQELERRYNSGERTADLIRLYANYKKDALQGSRRVTMEEYQQAIDKINNIVQDYFLSLNDADRLKEENVFIYNTYTNTLDDASAKFMIENNDKFTGDTKSEIDSITKKLYNLSVYRYLSNKYSYDASKIAKMKAEIKRFGLNDKGEYNIAFRIIDSMPSGTDKYFNVCDKNFKLLSETYQTGLITGICDKYSTADDATKKSAARVIRNNMSDFSLSVLYAVTMYLGQLEGKKH